MNRLKRFYNQNRYTIWIVILIIIAIITIIQILNKFAFEKNLVESNNKNIINNNSINKNYSVISGHEVKDEVSEIIEQFINYCNNQEVENAYNLLSEDCKEILYPSVKDFEQKYYDNIFTEKKGYLYQAWITNNNLYTYKVDFVEDILATGKTSQSSITDYYTIIRNGDEYKLNINKFISSEDINKTQTNNNITVNVIRKRIYMDYEIYEMKVQNNMTRNIMLDDLKSTRTVYLQDENGQEYYWFNHEILETDIIIKTGFNQEIEIKFNKGYKPSKKITKIVFSNIVINNKEVIGFEVGI